MGSIIFFILLFKKIKNHNKAMDKRLNKIREKFNYESTIKEKK
jgi:hypothetical protein